MLQNDPNFVSCPNSECKSFGFTLKPSKCSDDYECSECNYKWRTSEQSRPFRFYLPAELSLFSNLYKVIWGEKCPGCQVFILHGGGCKFMECPLCKFQFCWWCQDEFYTEYHYNQTQDCPTRIYLFYAVVAFAALLLWAKLSASFQQIWQIQANLIFEVFNFIAGSIYVPLIYYLKEIKRLIGVLK